VIHSLARQWGSGNSLKSHSALLLIHGTKWRPIKREIHAQKLSGEIPAQICKDVSAKFKTSFSDLSLDFKKATYT